jgi:hypothetical protein
MRISNPPEASSLMATARSFGNYDLAAALADLIDNSIRAKAKNISIIFESTDKDIVVRIRDDGFGMDEATLIKAMRPASANPQEKRDLNDLGRFGWGLKSASLSQARILSVVSWRQDQFSAAIWDIDDLDDWSMELLNGVDALKLLNKNVTSDSGTEVIWSNSDRLFDLKTGATIDEQINEKISYASRQLALIFHRYISGEVGSKLLINIQGIQLQAIDPFMSLHPSTQTIDAERIQIEDKEDIYVKPYIIPHFSKLTIQEKELLGGDEGLVRNQGFYVYRNKRLIIYGTWFRLIPHGELSQLTRVRVDLPNTLDEDWKITLDKSDAQLPIILRTRLRELVKNFGKRSVSVNRKKGVDLSIGNKESVWKRIAYNGRIRYQINRDHPLIWEMIAEADSSDIVREALNIVESYVPTDAMIKDREGSLLDQVQSITDPKIFESLIDACFIACVRQNGKHPTLKQFLDFASVIEPFASQWKYSESYIHDNLKDKWGLK